MPNRKKLCCNCGANLKKMWLHEDTNKDEIHIKLRCVDCNKEKFLKIYKVIEAFYIELLDVKTNSSFNI